MTLDRLHIEILPRYICMCFKIPDNAVGMALPCAVLLSRANQLLSMPLGFQMGRSYPVAGSVIKPQRSVSLIPTLFDDSYVVPPTPTIPLNTA